MSRFPEFKIDNQWIASNRGGKNTVNPYRPYQYFIEKECMRPGIIDDVSTILLTNNECPFRCLMCDLWKNTTNKPVQQGAIPEQIQFALDRLPLTMHLKLYNSGNFFDPGAIPPDDYKNIAQLINHFQTIIVESHPAFIGRNSLLFHDLIKPANLQVAIGLETVHPEILPRLNKHMTLSDFEQAVSFLTSYGVSTRAFILLRPPFLLENEGVYWAKKSIDFAMGAGVVSCSVIPVRSGNGAMEVLAQSDYFSQPDIKSLEKVIEYGIGLKLGFVFADLWDIDRFSTCPECIEFRKARLIKMNLNQKIYPPVKCSCCSQS
jgi:archaeosine synthase beta-subunit